MKRLAALAAALALTGALAPTAQAQGGGIALGMVFIDCRVIQPGHGIDTHRATDYVEVTIINTALPYYPFPHPEGIIYSRDEQKVLYRVKDQRARNYSKNVPVDFCEWDIR